MFWRRILDPCFFEHNFELLDWTPRSFGRRILEQNTLKKSLSIAVDGSKTLHQSVDSSSMFIHGLSHLKFIPLFTAFCTITIPTSAGFPWITSIKWQWLLLKWDPLMKQASHNSLNIFWLNIYRSHPYLPATGRGLVNATGCFNEEKITYTKNKNKTTRCSSPAIFTLLGTITYPLKSPFWVDDVANLPFGGICFLLPWRVTR